MLAVLAALGIAFVIEWATPMDDRRLSRALGIALQLVFASGMIIIAFILGRAYMALGFVPIFPPIEHWAGPFAAPVALIVTDFLRYVEHRFEHRYWWRVHEVHHSLEDLHAANSYGHPLQALPTFFLVGLPLALLNFSGPAIPIAVGLVVLAHTFYIHSPTRLHLGPLRHVIVDNRFHRIHHSLEERHFGRNFGVLFTVWDRLFGTAYFPSPDEWPDVGVANVAPPSSASGLLAAPLRPRHSSGR